MAHQPMTGPDPLLRSSLGRREAEALSNAAPPAELMPSDAPPPDAPTDLLTLAGKFSAHSGGGLPPQLSAALALEIVLNEIVEQACLATGADGAAIVVLRDGEMICRASSGAMAPELGARLNLATGLAGECILHRRAERCDDTEIDPRADIEASRRLGVRSVVIFPLLRHGELIGILEIFASRPGAFGERDERTLEALAHRVLNNFEQAAAPAPTAARIPRTNGPHLQEPRIKEEPRTKAENSQPETAPESGLRDSDFRSPGFHSSVLQTPDPQFPEHGSPDPQPADQRPAPLRGPYLQTPSRQKLQNPYLRAPSVSATDFRNADGQDPDVQGSEVQNPNLQNSDLQNPDLQNSGLQLPHPSPSRRRMDGVAWLAVLSVLGCLGLFGFILSRRFGSQLPGMHQHTASASLPRTVEAAGPVAVSTAVSGAAVGPAAGTAPGTQSAPNVNNSGNRDDAQSASSAAAAAARPSFLSPPPGSLLVYENGKEVFRMEPSSSAEKRLANPRQELLNASSHDTHDMQQHDAGRPEAVQVSQAAAEQSIVYRVEPEYPEDARQQRIQGPVVLDARIGIDGYVKELKLVSGPPALVLAAAAAVKQWRFQPKVIDGTPAEVQTSITINFRLPQ